MVLLYLFIFSVGFSFLLFCSRSIVDVLITSKDIFVERLILTFSSHNCVSDHKIMLSATRNASLS